MTYRFTLYGPTPSKKNAYSKQGGKGSKMYISAKLKAKLDYLALQVPPECRNLQLVSPHVMYEFVLPANTKKSRPWQSDWDGRVQTIQDILVKLKVFKNDNFQDHNGYKRIPPARVGDAEAVTITIYAAEEAGEPGGGNPSNVV